MKHLKTQFQVMFLSGANLGEVVQKWDKRNKLRNGSSIINAIHVVMGNYLEKEYTEEEEEVFETGNTRKGDDDDDNYNINEDPLSSDDGSVQFQQDQREETPRQEQKKPETKKDPETKPKVKTEKPANETFKLEKFAVKHRRMVETIRAR